MPHVVKTHPCGEGVNWTRTRDVVAWRLLCASTAFILSGEMKRPTPCFNDWLVGVDRALAVRGRKAELARYLAKRYGRPPRSWEATLAQILGRVLLPNAEIVLAINGWLSRKKSRRASGRTSARKSKS